MDSERQTYQYLLNIAFIKMTVRFPCKMKLQHNGKGITNEVPCTEGQRFIFNQDVVIKQETQKPSLQISVNLVTDKGGNYISGVLKISHSQLIRSQGQKIIAALTKCLDTDAFCELRINKTTIFKSSKKAYQGMARSKVSFQIPTQPLVNQKKQKQKLNSGTKSEFQFVKSNPKRQWQGKNSKLNVSQSFFQRNMNKSPHKSPERLKTNRSEVIGTMMGQLNTKKDEYNEAQVYKQGYNKLKQKYRKQADNAKLELGKRIQLETVQNNLKLQIMRLKLKNEQLQKTGSQKNIKIKEMQNQISTFQKKQLDMGYIRQEMNNKDHNIRILQDNIRTITRENEQLKINNNQRAASDQEKIKQLKRQIESLNQKFETKEIQFDRQLKIISQNLHTRESELQSKCQALNRQKKAVDQLQKQNQRKSLEYEKIIQNEKSNTKTKTQEFKMKIQKLQKNVSVYQNQKMEAQTEIQKLKSINIKHQYQNRILIQQIESLKTQLAGLKTYKDKYLQLFRDNKLLTEDKNHLLKQLQKANQSKQISATELNKQHLEQIQYFRKANKQLDQKQKQLSSKISQLEGLLSGSTINLEKNKKSLQLANNQLNEMKQKQKSIKKVLKAKEQQYLGLQNEISIIKQKNKNSEQYLTYQLQKYKEQLEKTKSYYQNQNQKANYLSQQNSQMNMQLGKLKVKLQFTQEKLQKDDLNLKQKKIEMQNMIKDYQAQIMLQNQSITELRTNQKDLILKIQKQQLQGLRTQQKVERLTKQIRIIDQKYIYSQNLRKSKQNQSALVETGKKTLELKLQKNEETISILKNDLNHYQAEKQKNEKVIQLMKEENTKLRKQNQNLKLNLGQKQQKIQQISIQIKKIKEQLMKSQLKLSNITRDFERFKQSTMDGINMSFSQVLPETKQIISSRSNKNLNTAKIESLTSADINNLILNYSKQTKITINKLTEQNRQLSRQVQKLNQELAGNINKGQTSQYQYSKQIEDYQSQIATLNASKEEERVIYDHNIKQLMSKVKERERQIKSLNLKCDELTFSLTALKTDHINQMEQQNKKNLTLRNKIGQLESEIQFLNVTIINMEQRINDKDMECQGVRTVLRGESQNGQRKDRIIAELKERRQQLQLQIQDGKKYRKQLLDKNSTLELLLNSQREQTQSLTQMLDESQQKTIQMKAFINNLIKQKQGIIKTELQKAQKNINLQNLILELNREKDILSDQKLLLLKQIDENKEINKKLLSQNKQAQNKILQEKARNQKITQRIKQVQKQVIIKQQEVEKLQAKIARQNQRGLKEGSQLRQELQLKTEEMIALSKEHNQRYIKLQTQKNQLEIIFNKLKVQAGNMEEEIFNLKHSNETSREQISSLNEEIMQLRKKNEAIEQAYNQIQEEIKQVQQNSFELSGKVYNLQNKLQSQQRQKLAKIQLISSHWSDKYDQMCQEYDQRIKLIEKQKQFYQQKFKQEEHRLKKMQNEKNTSQVEDSKIRTQLQDKIYKVEEDRLAIISQKNSEIQKISFQNKNQLQIIRVKEAQCRRMLQQLQMGRNSIGGLEAKIKQLQEKLKNSNKAYQLEIDQLKKKQNTNKSFKDQVANRMWTMERQLKRIIQLYIKKGVQVCQDPKISNRFLQSVKNFEKSVQDVLKFDLESIN